MKLSEAKDVVREHVGRDKLSDPQLDWCMQRGLREIEKAENFYWMETHQQFHIIEDQQEYTLEDIGVVDYKESEIMLVSDRTADDPDWSEVIGPEMLEDTKPNFSEASTGKPAFFTMREEGDDPSILFWPPLPEQDFLAQWYYYKWTSLPTAATSDSHEVLRRWPEALIYLATEQGILTSTKDVESAGFWRSQFTQAEWPRMKLYQQKRHSRQRFRTSSSQGATALTDRLRQQQKAWF